MVDVNDKHWKVLPGKVKVTEDDDRVTISFTEWEEE